MVEYSTLEQHHIMLTYLKTVKQVSKTLVSVKGPTKPDEMAKIYLIVNIKQNLNIQIIAILKWPVGLYNFRL